MAADFYSILDNFKNFIGGRTGLFHWCLFCLAVVMLFFLGRKYQEEKQTVRFLVWPTILVLLFLFNPLFYRYVGSRFFAGVYWRLFWFLSRLRMWWSGWCAGGKNRQSVSLCLWRPLVRSH